ncbi:aminoglycoside N(3)-acetyltransferase [Anaerorhabdus sp.]|uniref:aminoglycoside N(3)-acetyltransferase n=1 Tax=Anaerorhabdus sp. TaxID=1872524 RepID=UPI002FC72F1A
MKSKKIVTTVLTKKDLMKHFIELGIKPGMILEVHGSLSSFGYVVGGAQTVVDALIDVVGYSGTILMPMHCGNNTEPTFWENPPVEIGLADTIRENTPAFHKKESEVLMMGVIVENLRRRDGAVISNHPNSAYVAWGKYAKLLCNRHSLHFSLSEESPTARLYELKGHVLLLGVGFNNCTAMHLAEYRSDCRPILLQGASVEIEGRRVWKKYLDIDVDSDEFVLVELELKEKGALREMRIGNSDVKLFRADVAIDEMVRCFENRSRYEIYR